VSIRRSWLYALFASLGLVGAALVAGSMDFGGDAVRKGAVDGARSAIGVDLEIGSVRGNPFRGYVLESVALKMKGALFASAAGLAVRPALMPLLSGKVVIDSIALEGGRIDGDRVFPVLAKLGGGGGSGPIPIRSIRLRDVRVASKHFATALEDMSVSISEKDVFLDGSLTVRDVPLSVRSRITTPGKNGAVSLQSLEARLGAGTLEGAGTILPSLGLKGKLGNLDVASLARLWPGVNPEDFGGLLSGSVEAGGAWNDPVLSGTIDYRGARLAGYPIQEAAGVWGFSKMSFSLNGMKICALGVPIHGDAGMTFGKGAPTLSLNLSGGPISAAEIAKAFPAAPAMTGTIERVVVSVQGTTKAPGGSVNVEASELGAFGKKIRDAVVNVRFAKDGSAAITGNAVFEGAPMTTKGTLWVNAPKPKIDMTVTCRSLNAEAIKAFLPGKDLALKGVLNGDLRFTGTPAAPLASGSVWSDRLVVTGESVEKPGVSFVWDGKNLSMKTLKGRWRGTDLTGSGKIGNVLGSPTLDLSVSGTVGPGFAESFLPGFSSYGVQGTADVVVKAAGTLPKPKISVTAKSKQISAQGCSLGGVSAATSFELPVLPKGIGIPGTDSPLAVEITADSLSHLKNMVLSLRKEKETITIGALHIKSGEGVIEGSGTILLPGVAGGAPEMKLALKLAGADLKPLALSGGVAVPLSGQVDGTVSLSGTMEKPSIAASLKSRKIAAAGFAAEKAELSLSGSPSRVTIENFSAEVGGGTLEGKGTVVPGATPEGTFSLAGKKLDAAVLLSALSSEMKPSGTLDLAFSGRFKGSEGSGEGSISSPALKAYGLTLSGISIPLKLSGPILEAKGARAEVAGGKASASGTLDIRSLRFSKKLSVTGAELGDVIQALRRPGETKRMLSGRGDLELSVTGIVDGRKVSLSGKGELTAGEGLVEGIPLAGLLAPLTGQPGIRFASATIPFVVESDRIRLLAGSKVVAPDNDPIYRRLNAEGPVTFAGGLNLKCVASANMALLSALIDGGVAAGTASNVTDMLTGMLSGVKSGLKERDYRDVSFKVGGRIDAPTASGFSVAEAKPATPATAPSAPAQNVPSPAPTKSPEEKIINTLLDVVAPKKK
jgi:hypothetical protein